MPKMKSNKSAAKRFKRSAGGSFRHRQSHRSHILTKKDAKRKRQLRPIIKIDSRDQHAIERMLPYA